MPCVRTLRVIGLQLFAEWTGTTGSTQTDKAVAGHSGPQSSKEPFYFLYTETSLGGEAHETEKIMTLGTSVYDGESSHTNHDCVLSYIFNSYLISYKLLCNTNKCTH